MQRRAFEYTYGDFWFVRLPWKGVRNPETWYDYAHQRANPVWQKSWNKTIEVLNRMDKDKDGVITVSELDERVYSDGIIKLNYRAQIDGQQRCRAASLMTFLLRYNLRPFKIEASKPSQGVEHLLFDFPACGHGFSPPVVI